MGGRQPPRLDRPPPPDAAGSEHVGGARVRSLQDGVVRLFLKEIPSKNQKNFLAGGLPPPRTPRSVCAGQTLPPKLAALRRGARREKKSFCKSKKFKKFQKFFPSQTPGHLVVVGRLRLYAESA